MADWFEELSPKLIDFVRAQQMFFISTAPPDGNGYPNLSPKGYDCLEVLGSRELVYADLGGSGNQTASHVIAGGRVTIMVCGFEKQALILRIYGRGRIVGRDDGGFSELVGRMRDGMVDEYTRQLIAIDVDKVQTSCGWGVPRYEFQGERDTLRRYWEKTNDDGNLELFREATSKLQEPV